MAPPGLDGTMHSVAMAGGASRAAMMSSFFMAMALGGAGYQGFP
jgi:hypothetical protein